MYKDGYGDVTSLDYSPSCIESMRSQYPETENFRWSLGDMTTLDNFEDCAFDLVVDKAAMDALMVDEGDVWHPESGVVKGARSMCRAISRVLKVGGVHVQVSFAQPHFRRKYLLGVHGGAGPDGGGVSEEFGWDLEEESIAGDNDGCFHHFFYVMRKKRDGVFF